MNDGYNLLMRQTLTPRTTAHTLNSTFCRSIDNTNVHQHETIEGSEIEEAGQRNQFVKLQSTDHTHTQTLRYILISFTVFVQFQHLLNTHILNAIIFTRKKNLIKTDDRVVETKNKGEKREESVREWKQTTNNKQNKNKRTKLEIFKLQKSNRFCIFCSLCFVSFSSVRSSCVVTVFSIFL